MSVRCKFKVDKIERTTYGDGVTMSPVYSNDQYSENARYWRATPTGELRFTSTNKGAMDQLELGKEYYIDISPADVST